MTNMSTWKTDPLIDAIFSEIAALWDELAGPNRPQLFRVEERAIQPWEAVGSGRLRNIWVFDGHGARLATILRREEHDFGAVRGDFSQFGLVRFAANEDGTELVFDYR